MGYNYIVNCSLQNIDGVGNAAQHFWLRDFLVTLSDKAG
jgi:hypothetical protein